MLTAAILPVKSFARAKQRLGASVEDPLRLALAAAMVADVLAALAATEGISRTFVVTREPDAAAAAREHGAAVVADDSEAGQSDAAALGIAAAVEAGFERVLCVPGDCPALDPGELAALLGRAATDGPRAIVLPDRHGTGTNGLLLSPPDAIAPSFGPGSCGATSRSRRRRGGVPRRAAAVADARRRHRRGPGGAARDAGPDRGPRAAHARGARRPPAGGRQLRRGGTDRLDGGALSARAAGDPGDRPRRGPRGADRAGARRRRARCGLRAAGAGRRAHRGLEGRGRGRRAGHGAARTAGDRAGARAGQGPAARAGRARRVRRGAARASAAS